MAQVWNGPWQMYVDENSTTETESYSERIERQNADTTKQHPRYPTGSDYCLVGQHPELLETVMNSSKRYNKR